MRAPARPASSSRDCSHHQCPEALTEVSSRPRLASTAAGELAPGFLRPIGAGRLDHLPPSQAATTPWLTDNATLARTMPCPHRPCQLPSSVDKIGRAVQETLPEEDVSTGVRQRSRTQAGSNEPKHLALH
ncbi:hypothetical protein ACCO45_003769 [Purpureocillium lilacinum]|uniref:Uncharacterized protein n=1 Tax=Purpureocillium lilacinum TaxID=33203 RepID=A0ACC4E3M1_PURLI